MDRLNADCWRHVLTFLDFHTLYQLLQVDQFFFQLACADLYGIRPAQRSAFIEDQECMLERTILVASGFFDFYPEIGDKIESSLNWLNDSQQEDESDNDDQDDDANKGEREDERDSGLTAGGQYEETMGMANDDADSAEQVVKRTALARTRRYEQYTSFVREMRDSCTFLMLEWERASAAATSSSSTSTTTTGTGSEPKNFPAMEEWQWCYRRFFASKIKTLMVHLPGVQFVKSLHLFDSIENLRFTFSDWRGAESFEVLQGTPEIRSIIATLITAYRTMFPGVLKLAELTATSPRAYMVMDDVPVMWAIYEAMGKKWAKKKLSLSFPQAKDESRMALLQEEGLASQLEKIRFKYTGDARMGSPIWNDSVATFLSFCRDATEVTLDQCGSSTLAWAAAEAAAFQSDPIGGSAARPLANWKCIQVELGDTARIVLDAVQGFSHSLEKLVVTGAPHLNDASAVDLFPPLSSTLPAQDSSQNQELGQDVVDAAGGSTSGWVLPKLENLTITYNRMTHISLQDCHSLRHLTLFGLDPPPRALFADLQFRWRAPVGVEELYLLGAPAFQFDYNCLQHLANLKTMAVTMSMDGWPEGRVFFDSEFLTDPYSVTYPEDKPFEEWSLAIRDLTMTQGAGNRLQFKLLPCCPLLEEISIWSFDQGFDVNDDQHIPPLIHLDLNNLWETFLDPTGYVDTHHVYCNLGTIRLFGPLSIEPKDLDMILNPDLNGTMLFPDLEYLLIEELQDRQGRGSRNYFDVMEKACKEPYWKSRRNMLLFRIDLGPEGTMDQWHGWFWGKLKEFDMEELVDDIEYSQTGLNVKLGDLLFRPKE